MAFRHYTGQPPVKSVVWICPSCGVQNTGALEAGCQACKAGADAGKAAPRAVEAADVDPQLTAYHMWRRKLGPITVDWDLVRLAWFDGAAWAQQSTAPAGNASTAGVGGTVHPEAVTDSQGGYTVALFAPTDIDTDGLKVDPRTSSTILAALAFYRDNQLAYGNVPGQLDAQEVSALIEKLTPPEEVPA